MTVNRANTKNDKFNLLLKELYTTELTYLLVAQDFVDHVDRDIENFPGLNEEDRNMLKDISKLVKQVIDASTFVNLGAADHSTDKPKPDAKKYAVDVIKSKENNATSLNISTDDKSTQKQLQNFLKSFEFQLDDIDDMTVKQGMASAYMDNIKKNISLYQLYTSNVLPKIQNEIDKLKIDDNDNKKLRDRYKNLIVHTQRIPRIQLLIGELSASCPNDWNEESKKLYALSKVFPQWGQEVSHVKLYDSFDEYKIGKCIDTAISVLQEISGADQRTKELIDLKNGFEGLFDLSNDEAKIRLYIQNKEKMDKLTPAERALKELLIKYDACENESPARKFYNQLKIALIAQVMSENKLHNVARKKEMIEKVFQIMQPIAQDNANFSTQALNSFNEYFIRQQEIELGNLNKAKDKFYNTYTTDFKLDTYTNADVFFYKIFSNMDTRAHYQPEDTKIKTALVRLNEINDELKSTEINLGSKFGDKVTLHDIDQKIQGLLKNQNAEERDRIIKELTPNQKVWYEAAYKLKLLTEATEKTEDHETQMQDLRRDIAYYRNFVSKDMAEQFDQDNIVKEIENIKDKQVINKLNDNEKLLYFTLMQLKTTPESEVETSLYLNKIVDNLKALILIERTYANHNKKEQLLKEAIAIAKPHIKEDRFYAKWYQDMLLKSLNDEKQRLEKEMKRLGSEKERIIYNQKKPNQQKIYNDLLMQKEESDFEALVYNTNALTFSRGGLHTKINEVMKRNVGVHELTELQNSESLTVKVLATKWEPFLFNRNRENASLPPYQSVLISSPEFQIAIVQLKENLNTLSTKEKQLDDLKKIAEELNLLKLDGENMAASLNETNLKKLYKTDTRTRVKTFLNGYSKNEKNNIEDINKLLNQKISTLSAEVMEEKEIILNKNKALTVMRRNIISKTENPANVKADILIDNVCEELKIRSLALQEREKRYGNDNKQRDLLKDEIDQITKISVAMTELKKDTSMGAREKIDNVLMQLNSVENSNINSMKDIRKGFDRCYDIVDKEFKSNKHKNEKARVALRDKNHIKKGSSNFQSIKASLADAEQDYGKMVKLLNEQKNYVVGNEVNDNIERLAKYKMAHREILYLINQVNLVGRDIQSKNQGEIDKDLNALNLTLKELSHNNTLPDSTRDFIKDIRDMTEQLQKLVKKSSKDKHVYGLFDQTTHDKDVPTHSNVQDDSLKLEKK